MVQLCQKPLATPILMAISTLPPRLPPHTAQPAPPRSRRSLAVVASATSDSSSSSSNGNNPPANGSQSRPGSLRAEAEQSNREVYDRLIDVFLARNSEDWRKLIAHSQQWPTLSEGVLKRMEERAVQADIEAEEEEARRLRRTARRLKSVSDELSDYAALVTKYRSAPSREWESMVALYRNALSGDFFDYIELRVRAAAAAAAATGQEVSREAEAIAALGTQLAALVEAHDRVLADEEALDSATERFAELLQSESMEAAEAKLDELAASGRLDPALLLTMAKAYAGVKETDITQEEVKDIMAHLYFKAKETFAQQAPAEARILKFLLAVESEADRYSLMEQSFQAGPELSTSQEDYLHTTPPALLNTIENVLAMYDGASGNKVESAMGSNSGPMGMAGQAASLMNPEVISRLRELQLMLRKKYL